MHSSGWMYSIVVCSNSGSSLRGWMQSTGHTSTHAVSFVPMHGSVMMNGMLACLRSSKVVVTSPSSFSRSAALPGGATSPSPAACVSADTWVIARRVLEPGTAGLYLAHLQKHHRVGGDLIAHRLVERPRVAARVQRDQ